MDDNVNLMGGWPGLDDLTGEPTPKQEAQIELAKEQDYDLALSYLRCFSTPDGVRVLEDFEAKYIYKNAFVPGMEDPVNYGFFMEGHRNLVLRVLLLMDIAREGSPLGGREIEL